MMKQTESKGPGKSSACSGKQDFLLEEAVRRIIQQVREQGVKACIELTKRFDQIRLREKDMVISVSSRSKIVLKDPEFEEAVLHSMKNIALFHEKQKMKGFVFEPESGVRMEERWIPLDSVGCYVPGGSAPLVSTVLMTVIPAKLAGVKRIVLCTPPDKKGGVNPYICYVAQKLGVNQILLLGGAQAIAALAFGIKGLEPVQKIVGPGNRYVTEAKRQLFGTADIDMLAGPSEICILADGSARPEFIAADVLSQLEHDPHARAHVISTSAKILEETNRQVHLQKKSLSRKSIVEKALENKNLHFLLGKTLEACLNRVDSIAPEHLEVMMNPLPDKIRKYPFKAGAVFFGSHTPVVVGDVFGGTNHVLPTGGRAAFSSPLSVYDFYRRSSSLSYSKDYFFRVGRQIEKLSSVEELPAHCQSVAIRLKG
ncbi:MAG: histidinol dehydrogenase [Candidatus Aureabacteria bacterium]|nr:histidinol dehydrogenase [Candidatus Auribacterota bacterium]